MVYQFAKRDFEVDGGSHPVDPQKVGEELSRIEAMTPKKVVDFGKQNKDSEVAKFLEWNDDYAAYQYRYRQAEELIENLVIVVKQEVVGGQPVAVKVKAYQEKQVKGFQQFVPVVIKTSPQKSISPLPGPQGDIVLQQMINGVDELRSLFLRHHNSLGIPDDIDAHLAAIKHEIEAKIMSLYGLEEGRA